jgi:ATP-dependent helicase HrpA
MAGLLSHVGFYDPQRRDYRGARNARFVIAGGSVLRRKAPRWVVAAELVETDRLTARTIGKIRPEWAEDAAPHLVRYSYGEPVWSATRGSAQIPEHVTLYGLPLVSGRWVQYGRIDPAGARRLFIRHALVGGEWDGNYPFAAANRAVLAEVHGLQARTRRADLVVDDERLVELYDARLPAEIHTVRAFDRWWRRPPAPTTSGEPTPDTASPERLRFTIADVLGSDTPITAADYPDELVQDGHRFPLTYVLDPGAPDDGLVVDLPLAVLNQVTPDGFDWLVAGWRAELVGELLRTLPKALRRALPALGEVTAALVGAGLSPAAGPLTAVVAAELLTRYGVRVPHDAWQLERLPAHLRVTFRVVDDDGKELASGKDLAAVRAAVDAELRVAVAEAAAAAEVRGLVAWPGGELARVVETTTPAGQRVRAYPALVDEGETVSVRLLPTEAEQADAHWAGTVRLLRLSLPAPAKAFSWTNDTKLALVAAGYRSVSELSDDCITAAIEHLLAQGGGPVWSEAGFGRLRARVRSGYPAVAAQVRHGVLRVLAQRRVVAAQLLQLELPGIAVSQADIEAQVIQLVHPGFVAGTGVARLPDVVRYLQALDRRIEKLPREARKDEERTLALQRLERLVDALGPGPEVDDLYWMVQELRVSTFAQQLGTPFPVSEKRVQTAIAAVAAAHARS